MIEDDLRGIPRLRFEDKELECTCKEMVKQLKAKGYDIQDPRDDRDVIIPHEIEHTDREPLLVSVLQ